MAAAHVRRVAINERLCAGATLTVQTAFGPFDIASIDNDYIGQCYPAARHRSSLSVRSLHFHAGHLDSWESLIRGGR